MCPKTLLQIKQYRLLRYDACLFDVVVVVVATSTQYQLFALLFEALVYVCVSVNDKGSSLIAMAREGHHHAP